MYETPPSNFISQERLEDAAEYSFGFATVEVGQSVPNRTEYRVSGG